MEKEIISIEQISQQARAVSKTLAGINTEQKNSFLLNLADQIWQQRETILQANAADVTDAEELLPAMIDRLTLTNERIEGITRDIRQVAALPDPVGEEFEARMGQQGLDIRKVRTPIGVVAVIYESRPNVTIDTATLLLKSGNAAILRGGKETLRTNSALISIIHQSLQASGLPVDAVQAILSPDRALLSELLQQDEYIDMLIPRGGAGLHQFCRKNSRIPCITGGIGICHLFVDQSADFDKSINVIFNAKTQRVTVCNALDTILVHQQIAEAFIPLVSQVLLDAGVLIKADKKALEILQVAGLQNDLIQPAEAGDFDREWLSMTVGIHLEEDVHAAIRHIQKHSTGHSDGILTENEENARIFTEAVNSAAVYVNASTRFTDGSALGLGAEIAISTQPLQARGPMALRELTTYKYVIHGDYSVRK